MATVKRQNVCYGQEYTDSQGQTKTAWKRVGTAFHSDQGTISIKLDSIPCGAWNGWINLFDEREQTNNQGNSSSGNQSYSQPAQQPQIAQQFPQQTQQQGYSQPQGYQQPTQPQGGIQPNQDFAPVPPIAQVDDLPF